MIREYKKSNIDNLIKLIKENHLQNVYLYIDSQTYGFENENIMTWLLVEGEQTKAILYKYYNSLQIIQVAELSEEDIQDMYQYVNSQGFEMISGNAELLSRLISYTKQEYILTQGYILQREKKCGFVSDLTCWADRTQCHEIAELICSDDFIGGHYTVELLENQLVDRMDSWQCKNLIIMENGHIVSHMGTYAECGEIAVLGGLVTALTVRGKGYGKKVLNDLAEQIMQEGKCPILYCYNENLVNWYKKQGWSVVFKCGKLEKNREYR